MVNQYRVVNDVHNGQVRAYVEKNVGADNWERLIPAGANKDALLILIRSHYGQFKASLAPANLERFMSGIEADILKYSPLISATDTDSIMSLRSMESRGTFNGYDAKVGLLAAYKHIGPEVFNDLCRMISLEAEYSSQFDQASQLLKSMQFLASSSSAHSREEWRQQAAGLKYDLHNNEYELSKLRKRHFEPALLEGEGERPQKKVNFTPAAGLEIPPSSGKYTKSLTKKAPSSSGVGTP